MKKQILFVDDEVNVLDGLRRLLRNYAGMWDLCFAASVNEALRKIREVDFDVIVTDITMAGKDGFDLLRTLRESERTREIPVIVLTGLNPKDLRDQALRLQALDFGVTDLLSKPVEREALFTRIRNNLRLKSYQDEARAGNAKFEKKIRERTKALAETLIDILLRFAGATEYGGETWGNRGLKVGCYSRVIAETLGLDGAFVETIFLSSPLRDIGLIVVPANVLANVLAKKGALTQEDRDLIHRHCAVGHAILSRKIEGVDLFHSLAGNLVDRGYDPGKSSILTMASTIALTHHEWWNGAGYPNGLAGEDIPLESRIVAVADAFDELTSDRPCKKAVSGKEVIESILRVRGKQFAPEACDALEKCFQKLCSIQSQFSAPLETGRTRRELPNPPSPPFPKGGQW
ncbi:MAG: response regulator [Nitrospinae bacterium]|nr:response regulator [Nitrospinota bacterium]